MREDIFGYGDNRCRVLYEQQPGIPVMLLHGYSFTSDVWGDIGLFPMLEEKMIPYIAIDMPYGRISKCIKHTRSVEENIDFARSAFKAYFGNLPPVIVGASLGGYMALKYSMTNPATGLVLIAPVGVREVVKAFKNLKLKTLVLYGSRDDIADFEELKEFADETGSELIVYDGAGHALYLDQPERFKKDLLAFYERIVFKKP
ncbi:alpha/beta fold hydrolase [Thermogladius sp. 4427co]|uniref:alpha/beta fold hydrolase n=1 Tax=Thermogladius sp. 4427co TaxID=3450718 RepID=UPI003F797746